MTEEERRDEAVAAIEESIDRIVAQAPPLTAQQIDRLRFLFRGVKSDT